MIFPLLCSIFPFLFEFRMQIQTPLMSQYSKIKQAYPDTILLFRMGDFFETFEEDAKNDLDNVVIWAYI